ncbi:glycosyltransferase family 4 protein [Saccharothrix sp. NRRL B-16314]|uniref:glycosyltransferase family 4 protein n=1 Tax=Saccharothrix sp. NRRL B-16314 TaxID=1463825 RepID=UPI0005275F25|nr:glycosyltransferase family 4 protein [Saccharothrix sp. NRRL B-16314]
MRIAIAFDCLFPWTKGGGERLYRQFAEEFVAAGHEVTYLTRLQWDEEPVIEGIKIVAVSQDRDLYDANGVRTIGPALRYAYGLAKHLRANRRNYDAVLVSAVPSTNVLAVRAALVGSKVAVDVDWLEVWRPDQWLAYSGPVVGRVAGLLQWVAAKLSPLASCHSQLHARRLEAGGLRGKAIVSHGLIDPREDVVPNPAVTSPPRVVYVGRHIADKRVETLPAAIAEARESIPDLEATIFGEGTSRAAVLAEIDRLGLRDVVRTPGFVSQEELDEGIRTAAVLVNPSQREGYGLVVVESCAVGTPVVLVEGDDNAAVELVEPGVNGQVAKTTAGIGAAIVDVVKQGEPLRKSTHDWYARVSKTNTVRASARQILERLVQAAALR